MTVTEKSVEEVSRPPRKVPKQAIAGAGDAVNGSQREMHATTCSREADGKRALSLKNLRVKMQMAENLLRMGFSREAAGRILNVKMDLEEETPRVERGV